MSLAPSETRPLTRIGSDEDADDADDLTNSDVDEPCETAVSRGHDSTPDNSLETVITPGRFNKSDTPDDIPDLPSPDQPAADEEDPDAINMEDEMEKPTEGGVSACERSEQVTGGESRDCPKTDEIPELLESPKSDDNFEVVSASGIVIDAELGNSEA